MHRRLKPSENTMTFAATCLRLTAKAADVGAIVPVIESCLLARSDGNVVVEVHAAGVNPSDVKAAMGLMSYAVFPRTPGRDFAGVVVDGPAEWLGREVFGTSGDLGIRRDGTHASHLVVEATALVAKPTNMSMDEAAGIGVPFVTALEGFRRAGMPKPGETVLIMGVNGKVGQAAAQLATWRGARVIGVVRTEGGYRGHASSAVDVINAATGDVAARVRDLTGGRGADIVFNTVGDPYFEAAHRSLASGGRQILIAAIDRIVSFNIFEFYRGRHTYVGIDTLAFSSTESAAILREALEGFANGKLRPFPIVPTAIYPLRRAHDAYCATLGASRDRIILKPKA